MPHPCASLARRAPALLVLLLAASACGLDRVPTGSTAPISPVARAYLDTALTFTQATFYFSSRVDWPGWRQRTFEHAAGSNSTHDTHDVLAEALRELADPHTVFYVPVQTVGTSNPPPETTFHLAMQKTAAPRISYLWVPMFTGTNQLGRADSIQRAVAAGDATPNLCGWIVDLRGNPGGYWAPMLAGISPLVNPGIVAGFVERDTTKRFSYEVRPGSAGLRTADGTYFEYSRLPQAYTLRNPGLPMAVLQGDYTASAGEILVLAFRDPARTVRTFGGPSYGATSQPYTKTMPDTASLQVTAAMMFDRSNRVIAGTPIAPDQSVAGPTIRTSYVPGAASDAVIDAATAWLRTQSSCAALGTMDALRVPSGSGRWRTTPPVTGARPASEWPKGLPTPWVTRPPR